MKETGKTMRHCLFAGVLALGLTGLCGEAPPEVAHRPTTFAADVLRPHVERGELPGAISVFHKDGAEETCCIGFADVAAGRAITLDDPFMQCSQTKGFCGVTVAMLVEEGKVALDDPVSKYLPEFGELWVQEPETNGVRMLRRARNVLTVRMCLNHTGGLPFELANYEAMGGWSRRMPLRSVAATAAAQPLRFEPGTKVQYSNVGIDIAAAVVEKVTGRRWESFLQERLLGPLGMTSTGFWPSEADQARKIEMYQVAAGRKAEWKAENPLMARPYGDDRVFPSAGAGLWTTARDQLRFYKMLMNLGVGENGVRVLKAETVKDLLARSSRPKGMGGYSLGLSVTEVGPDDVWFGHGGAWDTGCWVNWRRKELKMWVVQTNGDPRPWVKEHAQAADRFFEHVTDHAAEDAYRGRLE